MKILSKAFLLLSTLSALSLSPARADLASTYLWNGGQSYGVFTMGSALGNSSFTNGWYINGAFGVGDGSQTLVTDAGSTFNGNLYVDPTATLVGTQTYTATHGKHPNTNSSTTESNINTGSTYFASLATTGTTSYTESSSTGTASRLFGPYLEEP